MSEILSVPDTEMQAIIKVRDLHKYFGALHVIKGVDLDVAAGEVVVVIGPSGGGKSTFLRCLNFLEEPSAGSIEVDGVLIKARQPAREQRRHQRPCRQQPGTSSVPLDRDRRAHEERGQDGKVDPEEVRRQLHHEA